MMCVQIRPLIVNKATCILFICLITIRRDFFTRLDDNIQFIKLDRVLEELKSPADKTLNVQRLISRLEAIRPSFNYQQQVIESLRSVK